MDDLVGRTAPRAGRPLLAAAYDEDRICREGDPLWHGEVPVREETIPVRGATGGPIATIQSFIADGLFIGQNPQFLQQLMELAAEAESALRENEN